MAVKMFHDQAYHHGGKSVFPHTAPVDAPGPRGTGGARRFEDAGGITGRINSALVTEQDLDHYIRGSKAVTGPGTNGQTTYTRFKPVTSYPTTSLIASLYKQHALGESRYQQQAEKLPNLFQQKQKSSNSAAYKRRRGLRSFAHPSHASNNSTPRSLSDKDRIRIPSGVQASEPSMSNVFSRGGSASTGVAASAAWSAVHASIAANGHSVFPQDQKPPIPHYNHHHQQQVRPGLYHQFGNLSQRSSVNYVPFYEIRGRGDGASVVDVPSIDIEGKKIDKIVPVPSEKPQPLPIEDPRPTDPSSVENANDSRTKSPTNTNEETLDSLVSALMRRSHKETGSSTAATPTKVEKKVRFNCAVVTNQIDEPSYTEALLQSLRSRMEKTSNASNQSVSSLDSKGLHREKTGVDSDSVASRTLPEDRQEQTAFVTPVMKVIVTKRRGSEVTDKAPVAAEKEAPDPGNPQRRVANMASRIISNHVSISLPNDLIRRGTQATRRASTAGQARSNEAMARVSKLVPKRQTVVMPNFPKQSAWSKRSLPVQSSAPRMRSTVTANSAFTAAVRGSRFDNNNNNIPGKPISRAESRQNPENLRSRLTSAKGGVYLTTSPQTKRASPNNQQQQQPAPDRPKPRQSTPKASLDNTSTSATNSAKNGPEMPPATDFQPIPSMPDHINFCDSRKTDMILRWLDDVNKKRNIDSKLKRSTNSQRLKSGH